MSSSTSDAGGSSSVSSTNTSSGTGGADSNTTDATNVTGGGAGTGGTSGGEAGAGGTSVSTTGGGNSNGTGGAATNSTSTSTTGGGGTGACGQADCCPDDPDKTQPGVCGCGELETDSDSDATPDCDDLCPSDPDKVEPGQCGCSVREEDSAAGAGCLSLKNGLVHRYSFNGSGTEVSDTVGDADGTLVGTTLNGTGVLSLTAGGAEQYAELPAGVLSALTNATVEAWFSFASSAIWTRVFDFGSTAEGVQGERGTGETYVFFTPKSSNQTALPRAIFSNDGIPAEVVCVGAEPLSQDTPVHVAVAIDTTTDTLTLYIDGMLQSAKAFPESLATLDDVNNWIGRSQFEVDAQFQGSIEELRIYGVALTTQQVVFSVASGPNPSFLDD